MRLQFVGIIDLIFYNKLRSLVRQNYGKVISFYLDSSLKGQTCFKLLLTEYLYLYFNVPTVYLLIVHSSWSSK